MSRPAHDPLGAHQKARSRERAAGIAHAGAGTPYLAVVALLQSTGVKMVEIPYKGAGPALADVVGGHVPLTFASPTVVRAQILSGQLRALAVTSIKRSAGIPDLPTVAESGVPGYDVTSWNGVLVPAGTPTAIITRLNTEFNKALSSTEIREQLIASGYDPDGGRPERLGDLIRTETAKWAKVVKAANMTID